MSKQVLFICRGTGCVSAKADEIYNALVSEVEKHKLKDIEVDFSGCHGFCQQGPIVVVEPEGVFYTQVKVKDIPEMVQSHLIMKKPLERLFYRDPKSDRPIPIYHDIPFYKGQQRVILGNCGRINPCKIDAYIQVGGYQAIRKALLEMTPTEVIKEIEKSGLRGRGGAGFPTAKKWEICRGYPADERYIICNGDEGDPGAFMDRSILEADPHAVIEGMVVAAYAIGAFQGFIYVRAEYPLAVKRFNMAIKEANERGFLGENIVGSKFSLTLKVEEGAGAFVGGEETGLIAALEGKRAMPRPRPPYTAQSGFHQKPTIINNVKTLASVPVIIAKGAKWYAGIGTETSKGTAVFALTGKVANSGLVEVPMGLTLREIIFDIGEGIPEGKAFKAVQTGGPSGGCLPAEMLDLKVDYETLTKAGSMMGSGGMVVVDEETCMVDMAHYFLSFTQAESCGKCVPCRVGTRQMLVILDKIKDGKAKLKDIDQLLELANTIKSGALCGLGQTAPNPVLTTIRYFRDEYEKHITHKKCPAGVCKALISFSISEKDCTGCMACSKACPSMAISGEKKKLHKIDSKLCIKCGICKDACKFKAVMVQ